RTPAPTPSTRAAPAPPATLVRDPCAPPLLARWNAARVAQTGWPGNGNLRTRRVNRDGRGRADDRSRECEAAGGGLGRLAVDTNAIIRNLVLGARSTPHGERGREDRRGSRYPGRVAGGGRAGRFRVRDRVWHPDPALPCDPAGRDVAPGRPGRARERIRGVARDAGRRGRPQLAALR